MMEWLVNGVATRLITADDRGLHYGDGLFETIAIREGKPRLFERHIARLAEGCGRLGIAPPDKEAIRDELARLTGPRARGTAKIVVTRGPGPRGYQPPVHAVPTRLVGFSAAGTAADRPRAAGLRAVVCRTPASENSCIAGLKTLNRLDNVLARQEVAERAADEGLMPDAAGNVVGGTMSNLFAVIDGKLLTPLLARCGVRGIMRGLVLEAACGAGIDVTEGDIPLQSLAHADELFVTNALSGVRPIVEIEGQALRVGTTAVRISRILREHGIREALT